MRRVRDSLLLALVLAAGSTQAATIVSTFDTDDEGWRGTGDVTSTVPAYLSSGGNPGGTIEIDDQTAGGTWYYSAPAKFLGDRSLAYGQPLSFDLYQRGSGQQFAASDVALIGAGLILTIDAGGNPLPLETWVHYEVALSEAAGWVRTNNPLSLTGVAATQSDLVAVLGALDGLRIRGEFIGGTDFGRLDNVHMEAVPAPAAFPLLGSALLGLARLGMRRRRAVG
jgi:hypothetical protein